MAYNPQTGQYVAEDTDIEKRVTGLLDKDSPFMQQAETQGKQAANKRGLLNSSMGVQAAQASRVAAAVPIATNQASMAHDSNQRGLSMQQQDIAQNRSIDAQRELQQNDIGSREQMQAAQLAAEKERLGMQLSQQERLALQDWRESRSRLQMELGSRANLQQSELASRERMAQLTEETRERIAGLDREAQERIANLNVAASELQAASTLAANFEASYASVLANIMANPDIPAAERQRYMDHAARVRDSNLRLVEQFYSVDLNWQQTAYNATSTPYRGNSRVGGANPRLLR